MSPDAATLIRDALALDVDQRAVVVNALLESLHHAGGTGEVDTAWRAEVTRRLAEVRAGAVTSVDADERYASLRAPLNASPAPATVHAH
ncbi:addiction module protein [Kribbia dieselivorans]|uniref:addiction module protein n=1 Tax=Kribbia dieselivorans TaxID=331526 RepID=UPI0008383490|nr:addiction module protein [Kribbia dieselivorans]